MKSFPCRRRSIQTSLICAAIASACPAIQAAENPSGIVAHEPHRPAFKKGARLLFIGDSITDMKWGRNQKDRNHYLGHSYVFLIAARLHTDLPRADLEFFNRGISGHTVGNLRKRWQKDAIEMKPDILSILIGVNDVGQAERAKQQVDLKQWEADYRFILDASRKANPDLKIILLDPFVLPVARLANPTTWNQYHGECVKLRAIVKKLASDYQAAHITTQKVFDQASQKTQPDHWIWDGVHPLPQGHELIARQWIQTVSEHLKQPSNVDE